MNPQEIKALEDLQRSLRAIKAPDGGWPLKIKDAMGKANTRGACSHCKKPDTVNQMLVSVDCDKALCANCVVLPEYAKSLQLAA